MTTTTKHSNMISVSVVALVLALVALADDVSAFTVVTTTPLTTSVSSQSSSSTSLGVFGGSFDPAPIMDSISSVSASAASSFLISTIDSDIDSIPTNEFATVFAGGIAVMIGGLLSTVVLGTIIDKGNLYADLAAESYLQAEDDPEFWKNLSDEEQKKAKEVLAAIKASKEGGEGVSSGSEREPVTTSVSAPSETSSEKKEEQTAAVATKASDDMFSDYE